MNGVVYSQSARNRRMAARKRCGLVWPSSQPDHSHVCHAHADHAGREHRCRCGATKRKGEK